MAKNDYLESAVEEKLREGVKKLGGRCIKIEPISDKGWPDRCVLLPKGISVWVELKRPKGVLSKKQKHVHKVINDLGHDVVSLWSKEQVDSFLKVYGEMIKRAPYAD